MTHKTQLVSVFNRANGWLQMYEQATCSQFADTVLALKGDWGNVWRAGSAVHGVIQCQTMAWVMDKVFPSEIVSRNVIHAV